MSNLKTNFAVKSKYESFYTGGKIQISADGVYMFCGCGNKVNVFEIATGRVHCSIGEAEDEVITSFALTPSDEYLVLATQNLLLRQWNWRTKELIRTWKAIHVAPVMSMAFDSTSTLLATGGADSTVKLWDIEKQYCTHNLRGHQGVVGLVAFHPDISRLLLYSAGDDYKVRVWNLQTSSCIAEVGAHFSNVTALVFSADGAQIFSSGRDGIVAVWDADKHKVVKTIPVFESVESLLLVPKGSDCPDICVSGSHPHFITAGSKGILRVWNSKSSKCVYQTKEVHAKHPSDQSTMTEGDQSVGEEDSQNIVQMVHSPALGAVAVVTYDQNISLLSMSKLRLQKQFAGNNEEILDVKYFGPEERFALVATNSRHIKLFQLENWDCEILYGHTDIVLAVDVVRKGNRFISGSKDNTVRLWELDPDNKQVSCLAIGQGHTHTVGALAFSRLKANFFVSGSEDSTLKLWKVPGDLDPSATVKLSATVTERAHEKAVSCVEISPNDMFVASGSMDKTAKLWKASDLSLLGVLRGHRRGIWHVQFSPVDQILATASGDCTIKLWGLTDFSCVMSFEGHSTAVLRVSFINRGMQLLSSSTDGLVKLWTIKTNECVKTLDEHEDKVWSLAVNKAGDSFISGAADSSLIVWKDVTETEQMEVREKQEQLILQEQELSNLIQQKKYLKAIGLAITLEQPFRVLNIMKEILSDTDGQNKLYKTLEKLRTDQVDALLRFASQWNTNSRHCHEAQFVLSSILRIHTPQDLRALANVKSSVEGLLPYTDRHFQRLSRLLQQSMFLEYTWHCMKNVATDGSLPSTSVPMETDVKEHSNTSPSLEIDYDSSSESDEETEPRKTDTSKKQTANAAKADRTSVINQKKGVAVGKVGKVNSGLAKQAEESNSESSEESNGENDESEGESEESSEEEKRSKPMKQPNGESIMSKGELNGSESESDESEGESEELSEEEKSSKRMKKSIGESNKSKGESDDSEDESAESEDESEESSEEEKSSKPIKTPRLNLYKAYCGDSVTEADKQNTQNQKRSSKLQITDEKKKKRKMTDTYTVVKPKTKKRADDFFIDKAPASRNQTDKITSAKTDLVDKPKNNKEKISKSLAGPSKLRTKQIKLKKPRQVARYYSKQAARCPGADRQK